MKPTKFMRLSHLFSRRSGFPLRLWLGAALVASSAQAHRVEVPGPDSGTRLFGAGLVVLPNGNYLVTDPAWSAGPGADEAGAIYLYGANGALIGRLSGSSAGDRVGSGGIVVLASGDVVVQSPDWSIPGGASAVGAVTWLDADVGPGAEAFVDAGNSLIGGTAQDHVGLARAVALANGSYVVGSGEWDRPGMAVNAGAATWCAGDGSTIGSVSAANSLVGSHDEDRVGDSTVLGKPGVIALGSGHYVVVSSGWDDGATANVGAVTWGRDDGSVVGAVGAANSLRGARPDDFVGSEVLALTNGHYVVLSFLWDNAATPNVGAVTWTDGTQPTIGTVGPANSLLGTQDGDRVGYLGAVLTNGNYVIASPLWDGGDVLDVGAVTWRNGSGPAPGVVDATNSLVGSQLDDTVGQIPTVGIPPLGVIPLPGGDYVVASPSWNDGMLADVGAATWGDGNGGTTGVVSAQNSLVGAQAGDAIAQFVVRLTNGNYVIASPLWSNNRGASTWADGNSGVVGTVGAANSLVGENENDLLSAFGVYPLLDGGYVVPTPRWDIGALTSIGAITRAPADGLSGVVSASNSIVGTQAGDALGARGVVALPDGGFVVQSPLANGFGALTRFTATSPVSGTLVGQNSLVGQPEDPFGPPGARLLSDGAVILQSADARPDSSGAVTLLAVDDPYRGLLFEPDTVRSAVAGGGPSMRAAYLPTQQLLLVGDPAGNRVVRLSGARILRDGFEQE